MKKKKIVFVGGGTVGHVAPNIAIIGELKKTSEEQGIVLDLLYVGRRSGVEKQIAKTQHLKYKGIFSGKLRRYFSWRNITDPFLILFGFVQSIFILLRFRPDIIFAKGGFITVPFCLAAKILKVNFVIHESDSILGLSNKILLPFASKAYLGFPTDTYKNIPASKVLFTGNPVREEILSAEGNKNIFCEKYGLDKKRRTLFVFGGSQGASAINSTISSLLSEILDKYNLVHLSGVIDFDSLDDIRVGLEKEKRTNYLLLPNASEQMSDFLKNSDLIIARAGANSIAEIVALKKPSIIIPLPSAASDHQSKNALFLSKLGIASVLEEDRLSPRILMDEIDFLLSDKGESDRMIKNMKNIFPSNSAKLLAKDILDIIK